MIDWLLLFNKVLPFVCAFIKVPTLPPMANFQLLLALAGLDEYLNSRGNSKYDKDNLYFLKWLAAATLVKGSLALFDFISTFKFLKNITASDT